MATSCCQVIKRLGQTHRCYMVKLEFPRFADACCCINDWTTGTTKRIGEAEFSCLFSTSNAACDKLAMAEGIIDVLSAGAHQRRFSLVVPAGSNDRMARRLVASGFRYMLQVMCCQSDTVLMMDTTMHTTRQDLTEANRKRQCLLLHIESRYRQINKSH